MYFTLSNPRRFYSSFYSNSACLFHSEIENGSEVVRKNGTSRKVFTELHVTSETWEDLSLDRRSWRIVATWPNKRGETKGGRSIDSWYMQDRLISNGEGRSMIGLNFSAIFKAIKLNIKISLGETIFDIVGPTIISLIRRKYKPSQ